MKATGELLLRGVAFLAAKRSAYAAWGADPTAEGYCEYLERKRDFENAAEEYFAAQTEGLDQTNGGGNG